MFSFIDSSGDPRAASPDLISSIFPLLPSNWGSPSCSFLVWIGHCGLSVYRRYKQHDLFTLSPKVNHFHPNTLFSSSFIIHPKTNILHFFVSTGCCVKKFFRKALIMGDWSFRRLGDIIDRSNFQSVPPCDKPVNRVSQIHTRSALLHLKLSGSWQRNVSPLSRILDPELKLDCTRHMMCMCIAIRLWTCGALNKDERAHFKMHFIVESKSGRERFNFLDDFPSKLKC